MKKDAESSFPVRGFRLRPQIWEALKQDSEIRKLTILATLENILAAYYGMADLFVEPKDIQRARELLESFGYKISREDLETEQ